MTIFVWGNGPTWLATGNVWISSPLSLFLLAEGSPMTTQLDGASPKGIVGGVFATVAMRHVILTGKGWLQERGHRINFVSKGILPYRHWCIKLWNLEFRLVQRYKFTLFYWWMNSINSVNLWKIKYLQRQVTFQNSLTVFLTQQQHPKERATNERNLHVTLLMIGSILWRNLCTCVNPLYSTTRVGSGTNTKRTPACHLSPFRAPTGCNWITWLGTNPVHIFKVTVCVCGGEGSPICFHKELVNFWQYSVCWYYPGDRWISPVCFDRITLPK